MEGGYPPCRHGPLLQEKDRRIAALERRDSELAQRALRAEGEVLALRAQFEAEQALTERWKAVADAQRLAIAELQRALAELPKSVEYVIDSYRLPDAKQREAAHTEAEQQLARFAGGLATQPAAAAVPALASPSESHTDDYFHLPVSLFGTSESHTDDKFHLPISLPGTSESRPPPPHGSGGGGIALGGGPGPGRPVAGGGIAITGKASVPARLPGGGVQISPQRPKAHGGGLQLNRPGGTAGTPF